MLRALCLSTRGRKAPLDTFPIIHSLSFEDVDRTLSGISANAAPRACPNGAAEPSTSWRWPESCSAGCSTSLGVAPAVPTYTGAPHPYALHSNHPEPSSPSGAVAAESIRLRGGYLFGRVPGPPLYQFHQTRHAATSSATAAKAKARGDSQKPGASTVSPRVRTPEWAHMPLQLSLVPAMSRRRKTRLLKIRKQLTAEAAAAETGGWAAAKKLEATKAALQALPIPPEDSGEAELAAATTPGTSFEAACATMKGLCHRGVCLDAEKHLTPLLRKASTAGELAMFLELLRINHLVQAATKLGQHGALHDTLHDVLAQECVRLQTTAPLLELWNSLYEHGMEPTKKAAQAAVQTAVSLREGPAAAALLLLTAQYTAEPLAGTEAPAVLGLLEAESPEVAAKLRQRLPQLGIASTT